MIKTDDLITTDGYLSFCIENDICYIKTDFFYNGSIFWRGELHPKKISDICVVGHSDYCITDEIAKKFKKIFCVNRETNSDNVFGLPLGLTNDCNDSPIHQIYGNKDIMIEVMSESIDKKHLVYMNFNPNTYFERTMIWNYFSQFNWVIKGQIKNDLPGRKLFLQEIKSSKFVLCPRGNGIDTHRLWETLYMGSIPIVKYENDHHLFTDLPILFINDWKEINENFLNQKYVEIINRDWNLEKLKISYWSNFIKKNIDKDDK